MSIAFLQHHHKKIRNIGLGLVAWESFNFLFDFFFYPFALTYWGLWFGGAIAFLLASLINTAVFVGYEYMAIDWLGAHALRQLDAKENKTSLERLMTWMGKEKVTWWERAMSPLVFVALTLPIDPVIVAVHHRRQHFHGISWHDWKIFLAANAAANAWWLLKVGTIVAAAEWLYYRSFPALTLFLMHISS